MEKDTEDQLYWSCEKWSITSGQVGEDILQTIKRSKFKWIGHILRRNYLLKHNIEGKTEGRTEGTRWRWRRRK